MPPSKKPSPDRSAGAPGPDGAADESAPFKRFLDVPIDVTVELARKKVKVREVLNLKIDMVIEMDQSAGENVDLRLNGLVVGNGEIVVIENMMGLRVTDLKARSVE